MNLECHFSSLKLQPIAGNIQSLSSANCFCHIFRCVYKYTFLHIYTNIYIYVCIWTERYVCICMLYMNQLVCCCCFHFSSIGIPFGSGFKRIRSLIQADANTMTTAAATTATTNNINDDDDGDDYYYYILWNPIFRPSGSII